MSERKLYGLANEYAMGYLAKGRKGWDIPHTRAVFYYAKKLTEASSQDMLVIPTAALLHDIGYYGTFHGDSGEYQAVQQRKIMHMEVGAEITRDFVLRNDVSKLITKDQGDRIVHLVSIHDNLLVIDKLDEVILVEADTLGAIDVRRVKPTFNAEDRVKYLDEISQKREPVFRTELGKILLKKLIPRFRDYKG